MLNRLSNALQRADRDSKLVFLARLAHDITVAVRGEIHFSNRTESVRALNEIQHQITGRIMHQLDGDDYWTEEEFLKMLHEWAETGDCLSEVQHGLDRAYSTLG